MLFQLIWLSSCGTAIQYPWHKTAISSELSAQSRGFNNIYSSDKSQKDRVKWISLNVGRETDVAGETLHDCELTKCLLHQVLRFPTIMMFWQLWASLIPSRWLVRPEIGSPPCHWVPQSVQNRDPLLSAIVLKKNTISIFYETRMITVCTCTFSHRQTMIPPPCMPWWLYCFQWQYLGIFAIVNATAHLGSSPLAHVVLQDQINQQLTQISLKLMDFNGYIQFVSKVLSHFGRCYWRWRWW